MAQAFECHACLRRSLSAAFSVHAASRRPLAPIPRPSGHCSTSSRHQSSSTRAVAPRDVYLKSRKAWQRNSDAKRALQGAPAEYDDGVSQEQQRALKTELKYLRDPLKLAEHVAYTLRKDDEDKALALVRLSSRSLQNVVSWNRVIDWRMKKGKVAAAMEAYNEMKKRAQRPDSHTYLLLLRGLGDHAHHSTSLGRALSLYHSISAPHNPVALTIMHTNAVLKVCARAGDMDSMWDIASRLPERGPHAADNWTFTTILNNMRMQALTGGPSGETDEQKATRREAMIIEGRRLWQVIVQRWRAGDLLIDEELACSMGRLLLVGARPRDWDDVLSLLQQTMDLPRLIPRLGSVARRDAREPRIRAPSSPESMVKGAYDVDESSGTPKAGSEFDADLFNSPANVELPNPSANRTVRKTAAYAYAQPGQSTLSLVLESCLKMVAKQPALEYWHVLTDIDGRYAIAPDLDNMHLHLRILRQAHNSSEALSLLKEHFPAAQLEPTRKSFHIALAACVRDGSNPHVYDNAEQIVALALEKLAEPGALTFRLFLDVVKEMRADAKTLVRALKCLKPGTRMLRNFLYFGSADGSGSPEKDRNATPAERASHAASLQRERAEAEELLRRAHATYDRTVDICRGREQEMGVTAEDIQNCILDRSELAAFIEKYTARVNAAELKKNRFRKTKA